MKKILAILAVVLLTGYSFGLAEVLNDTQLAGIYAGDSTTDINDDILAENSAVVNQKNIGVIASTNGSVNDSNINNLNDAEAVNDGDSAVAIQTNIAAIGLGAGPSSNNEIKNENTATVDNIVETSALGVDAISDGSTQTGADNNSAFATVLANQSAVASQFNIGAVSGSGAISGTTITNKNTATVTNTGL